MRDPLWRKSPFLLLRFPALAAATLLAAVVLGLTSAAGTLFLASVESAALRLELDVLSPGDAGFTVSTYAVADEDRFAPADREVRDQAGRIPGLGEPTVMLRASPTARLVNPDGNREMRVQLLSRSGALDEVEPLDTADDAHGLWVPHHVAEDLGLRAGAPAAMRYGGEEMRVPVAGVYRGLGLRPPFAPLSEYWRPLAGMILPREYGPRLEAPPPLVLADEELFLVIGHSLGDNARTAWQFPLEREQLTPSQARRLAARYHAFEERALTPGQPLAEILDELSRFRFEISASSLLPGALRTSGAAVDAVRPSAAAVSLAGQAIALAVLAAAAVFRLQRRRTEARLLASQGVGAGAQGLRATVELAPATLLGVVAGWGLATWLVPLLGPSSAIDAGTPAAALGAVVLAGVAGLALIGPVTALGVLSAAEPRVVRAGQVAAKMRWELLLLVLAGVSYWQLATRPAPGAGEAAPADLLLVAFPLLFLAGAAGLGVRGLRRLQPRLRRAGGTLPAPAFLAARRLAGAGGGALLLLAGVTLSAGVLVYSATLVASAEATVDLKLRTALGARSVAAVPRLDDIPADLPATTAPVGRLRHASLLPGDLGVVVLAVDATRLDGTVRWPAELGGQRAVEHLAALRADGGERLPAIFAGEPLPDQPMLRTARARVPLQRVAQLDAFPGIGASRRLVVVDLERFRAAAAAAAAGEGEGVNMHAEVWSELPAGELEAALVDRGVVVTGVSSLDGSRARADVQAVGWTFSYLRLLGLLAGALALVGTVLYLQARQQPRAVFYALARRMGLTAGQHRRAVALELAGMLLTAGAAGAALGLVAARAVLGPFDPLPHLPPDPTLGMPWALLGVVGLVTVAAAGLGAWSVQRAAERTDVAEVLRVAA